MVLPCGSTTWSRFQRHACRQEDAAYVAWWQGSPGSLPYTGTVQVEFVADAPPNQYCVPLPVVTTHHSPSLSPLAAPVRWVTRVPSSVRRCQRFGSEPSLSSSPEWPLIDRVALSVSQHSSPVLTVLLWPGLVMSSAQPR